MSRLLIVAFDGHEAAALSGFASALGLDSDVLFLSSGAAVPETAQTTRSLGLTELPPADALAPVITEFAKAYTHVAAASTMACKDVMARVAGLLDAGMVTDVIAVESPTVFKRPIFAGTVITTVEVLATPVVLTVRPSGFAQAPTKEAASDSVSVQPSGTTTRSAQVSGGGTRPDLSQAKVVVSGGRPLKDAETFERLIGGLADALGGAVGATRAAVDSGIAPNELQVGQTGKIVAPGLYVAAGISGSTQHMAGIKDSQVIVAINNSADAPIFDFADFGLVADLYDAVPAITKLVSN